MTDLLPDEPLHRLRARRSTKWRAYSPEVLPLSIAEMDFALPDAVREALADAVERSDTGYAMPADGLGEALAGFAERRWGWRIDPAAATATTDVSAGVVEMLRLFTNPGETCHPARGAGNQRRDPRPADAARRDLHAVPDGARRRPDRRLGGVPQ